MAQDITVELPEVSMSGLLAGSQDWRTLMETMEHSTPQESSTIERLSQATSVIGNTVAQAGSFIPGVPGELAELIRRHPLPALLVGVGLGFLLGRSCTWTPEESSSQGNREQNEAGYPDALIQCLRCGQMVRQADMVSHSTTCRGTGRLSHGGSAS
jgi:hypothetical protein